jgi:hypothetical protein
VVAVAAELVADNQVVTGFGEHRGELADVTRHQHRVRIRAGDQETVCHIRAGQAEPNRTAGGNPHLGGCEREHERDHLHFDGAVGQLHHLTDLRESRIGEDLRRLDRLHVARGMESIGDGRHADHRDEHGDDETRGPHPDSFVEIDVHGVTGPRERYT